MEAIQNVSKLQTKRMQIVEVIDSKIYRVWSGANDANISMKFSLRNASDLYAIEAPKDIEDFDLQPKTEA
jgi:hypothetical protein